jgi:cytochrome c-type biogenesis protein CcmF
MNISINGGNILLIAALIFSLAALAAAVAHAAGKEAFAIPSRTLYLLAGTGIFLSVVLLLYYFVSCNFSFDYVFANSSRDLPLQYRVAAFWAGKEGSFLLWLFFLNLIGMAILLSKNESAPIVTSVILVSQIFILIILLVESPFQYLWDRYPENFSPGLVPGDGAGLNPLLKDPWMVAHPPVLFLGYASSTIPFGYAIQALIRKEYRRWIDGAYPWLLFSMVTLGIGIFLGGYWAYTVLGWGGYWGWDPVENSSLIPWLIAVAMVHGFLMQRRNGTLARLNIFLALFYFIMVFFSTWLTRSGVLSNFSVHSFAASGIRTFLLAFLIIYAAFSLALYIARFSSMPAARVDVPVFDWRTLTVYGIIVLMLYSLVILAGTSMPLVSQWFMAHPTSVTAAFYNNISIPISLLMLLLMTAATSLIVTKKENLTGKETIIAAALSLILGIAVNVGATASPFAYACSILSIFLVAMAALDLIKTKTGALLPSRLTHIGVALMALGIITSNFHTTSMQKTLVRGKETSVGTLRITFTGFKEGKESYLRFTFRDGSRASFIKTAYYFDEKMGSIYK